MFNARMEMRRIPQARYSDQLNTKYEEIYQTLPEDVRAEFEKKLQQWEKDADQGE